MGFRLDRSYRLNFEGTALEGAEVHIKNTSVATLLELGEFDGNANLGDVAELLATHVIAWNLENAAGEPIKLTGPDIIANVESVVLDRLITEWYRAARGITAPLDPPSTDGAPLEVESIPMEPLSEPPSTS